MIITLITLDLCMGIYILDETELNKNAHLEPPCQVARIRCSTYAHGHPLSLSVRRNKSNNRL